MNMKWYGHAAFGLTTKSGVKIIIDPYESGAFGGAIGHAPITDSADIVLISHDHGDHNHTSGIKGPFTEVRTEGSYHLKGVRISALPVYHDASQGKERGKDLIFVIEADGLKVVHTGDLGHLLDEDILSRIGKADVLMLPVGGTYTVNATEATQVMNAIKPSVTLPMHYKSEKVALPLAPVEDFTKDKKRVRKVNGPEIEVTPDSLPEEPEIVVLRFAN
jgi:L-ascorbate metabolism protein UlaG (beta-lactamase superfamily)